MLSKKDFKEIRKIVREEVETEIQNAKEDLQSEMKMNLIRSTKETRDLKDRIKNIDIKLNNIQKDMKYTINFLDKEGLKLQKRVDRIEKRLQPPPIS